MEIQRLGPGDEACARAMFATMAAVFGEGHGDQQLSDDYVRRLLSRRDFWAVVALENGSVIGGITAHALPMTRDESTELFIYDLAVRADRQRMGVGRALVGELLALAAAAGIQVSFVPADDEDSEAIQFYRACGGEASPVTFFTFTRGASGSR
jgi:aminoglycoside 3-N-acetyltransferase I